MINRVNTRAEAATFHDRMVAEYVARNIPAEYAPSLEEVLRLMGTDFLYMDNGLAPTFAGAERITLWVRRLGPPLKLLVWQAWAPTSIPGIPVRPDGHGTGHAGVLRWIVKRMIADGRGNVPIGAGDAGLPIVRAAKELALVGFTKDNDGIFWTTANQAEAQLASRNVAAVPA